MKNTKYYTDENDNLISVEVMQQMLGQTIGITKINAESIAVMTKDLEYVKNVVGGLVSKMNNHSDDIIVIKDRMTELELNEEITDEQANTINGSIKKRVAEILHFDTDEIAKYYQTFIQRCYKSLKSDNHMGASYRKTKKKYYQTIMDSIEAWIPKEGIQNLKDTIDKRANARKNAKKNGY